MQKAFKFPRSIRTTECDTPMRPDQVSVTVATMLRRAIRLQRNWAAPFRFRRYQPARQFLLKLACEVDPKVRAGIDPQRFGVRTIKQELNSTLTGRAGQKLAHLTQLFTR